MFEEARTRILKERGKEDPHRDTGADDLYELSDPDEEAKKRTEGGSAGPGEAGKGLREKMEGLKAAVATEKKDKDKKKRKRKKKPSDQSKPGLVEEAVAAAGGSKKKKRKKDPKKEQKTVWFGQEVPRKADTESNSTSSYESELSSSSATTKRKKGKKTSGKKKKKSEGEKKADRGPFGVGRKVNYEAGSKSEEEDSESQSFQGGAPEKRSQQLVLMEYADRKPGRLTSRLLQKMAKMLNRSGAPFHGVPAASSKTPAVATNYFLQVLMPTLKEKLNLRTQREMRTLAQVLDQLAEGRIRQGADILSQRLKSIELSLIDQGWQRAQHLELIPLESAALADVEEQRMASKEHSNEVKMKPWFGGGWKGKGAGRDREEASPGKGKGKGKKGKKDQRWTEATDQNKPPAA